MSIYRDISQRFIQFDRAEKSERGVAQELELARAEIAKMRIELDKMHFDMRRLRESMIRQHDLRRVL